MLVAAGTLCDAHLAGGVKTLFRGLQDADVQACCSSAVRCNNGLSSFTRFPREKAFRREQVQLSVDV